GYSQVSPLRSGAPAQGSIGACNYPRFDTGRFRVAQADLRESAQTIFRPRSFDRTCRSGRRIEIDMPR
ncbi:MAG TPA: hypothetical protein VIT66_08375, partial [Lysobacter sp.]